MSLSYENPQHSPASDNNWSRSLIDVVPYAVLCLSADGIILDANKACQSKLSRYDDHCVGKSIYDLIAAHPQLGSLLDRQMKLFPEVVRLGKELSVEDVQDGSVVRYSIFPFFSPDGRISRLCMIEQDVTPRHESWMRYDDLQQQWEFTLEQCRLGAWALDLRDGKVQHTLQHDRIFGYDRHVADWNYELFRNHIVADDRAHVDRLFNEMLDGRNGWEVEFRICRTDGEVRWIWDVGGVIRDTSGKAVRLLGVIQDITERKIAELERRDFQAKMDYALENSHVSFWTLDLEQKTVQRTTAHDRIFGYESNLPQWTVEKFFSHIHPDDMDMMTRAYDGALADRKDFRLECRIIRTDGSTAWISLVGTFTFDNRSDDRRHVMGIIQDITERKEAELAREHLQEQLQQFQKMDMVGQLAGGIAHDFNNVLTAILGNAEVVLRKIDRHHPFYENLDSICHAVHRSSEMVRQLLAFARKQVWSPQEIELDVELCNLGGMLSKLIRENIELRWELNSDHAMVRIDPSHLVQIITNLCVNSRDAITGEGVITIRTDVVSPDEFDGAIATSYPNARKLVRIVVSDTGCGIDPQVLPHIFEPFYTTKDVGKGTGLGLSVVYGIVKQNGGFIDCLSEPDKGTAFRLLFPMLVTSTEKAEIIGNEAAPSRYRDIVLLVENEPDILKIMCSILEEQGIRVLAAENAEEAFDLLHQHADGITLVISDVLLPGINGLQMSRLLQQEKPDLKFVFMSAYSSESIDQAGMLKAGVNFLSKPFTLSEFLGVVMPLLSPERNIQV